MKWGVRKARSRKPAHPQAYDSKRISELRTRKPHQLTDKQLQAVNKRLNLETNYSKMNPSTLKRGTVKAAAILGTIQLGITAYNMLQSPAAKAFVTRGRQAMKIQKRRGQQQLFF